MLKWSLPFLAALMPILLLSVYSYRIASDSVKDQVYSENIAATNSMSQFVVQEFKEIVTLMHAVSSLEGTLNGVNENDAFTLTGRMKGIAVAYPKIELAMVLNSSGRVMANYPTGTGSLDHADMSIFSDVKNTEKPVISGVRAFPENKHLVSISVPILSEEQVWIGALLFVYNTKPIVELSRKIEFSNQGEVFLLDHNGKIVAHPNSTNDDDKYSDIYQVKNAQMGEMQTTTYTESINKREMIATFLPLNVGSNKWVVISQQPKDLAYRELRRVKLNIGLAGGILTLVTLMLVIWLAKMSARVTKLNSELKQKNIKLSETAAIVSSSNDAIIGLDLSGKIESWNAAAEAIYGYKESDVIGKAIDVILPTKQQEDHKMMISKIRTGTGVKDIETVHVNRDKNIIPISVTLSPIKDEKGKTVGASATCRDITERKKVEQMKDDFISFVSHQLKAPIATLKWTLEMILDGDYGKVPNELVKPVKDMQMVVEQNRHLVGDILNASRIDRGVIAVDLKPVSLKDVVERSVRDYKVPMEEKGLKLNLEGLDQEIQVSADAEKFAEAVSNSVSNAIKHTTQGSITVSMKSEGKYGVIEVRDTGEGMDQEMVNKLFTRDKVVGKSAKAEKSAGLGLYIAKEFMTLQNGEVEVESEKGKGTVFIYRMPLG